MTTAPKIPAQAIPAGTRPGMVDCYTGTVAGFRVLLAAQLHAARLLGAKS